MDRIKEKRFKRIRRHLRVRKKVFGTAQKPRLSVYRSLKHIYGQLIDDTRGVTLLAVSSLTKDLREQLRGKKKTEQAMIVGEYLGKKALEKGITQVVFDRGGFLYHGRVKAFADGARKAGLKF
ncbi:50S ribosomal protein L18 [candidate division WOR-3 bacterium]|nr:50S ribosomal protein L18 [candidate division WOR-3 bacterium]